MHVSAPDRKDVPPAVRLKVEDVIFPCVKVELSRFRWTLLRLRNHFRKLPIVRRVRCPLLLDLNLELCVVGQPKKHTFSPRKKI
jgi:hypothetical protein